MPYISETAYSRQQEQHAKIQSELARTQQMMAYLVHLLGGRVTIESKVFANTRLTLVLGPGETLNSLVMTATPNAEVTPQIIPPGTILSP